ncbi:MAG TPA: hypothetical protein VMK53_02320, partial [Gemmatimonadales bacterium]|nr:hypothetical protein [Gemmatimonadales bacterium]
LEARLVTPPVRYSKPELQAHITYLYGMSMRADQQVSRDARERLAQLREELAARTAEFERLGGRRP